MFVDIDEIGIDKVAEHLNVEKPITKDKLVQLLEEEGLLLSLNSILDDYQEYLDDIKEPIYCEELDKEYGYGEFLKNMEFVTFYCGAFGADGRYVHIDDVAKELQDQKLLKG